MKFSEEDIRRNGLPRDVFQLIHDLCYHHDGRDVYDYVRRAQEILKRPSGRRGRTPEFLKTKNRNDRY